MVLYASNCSPSSKLGFDFIKEVSLLTSSTSCKVRSFCSYKITQKLNLFDNVLRGTSIKVGESVFGELSWKCDC